MVIVQKLFDKILNVRVEPKSMKTRMLSTGTKPGSNLGGRGRGGGLISPTPTVVGRLLPALSLEDVNLPHTVSITGLSRP